MSYTVFVRHLAEQDAAEAQDWYQQQRPGLGADFNHEFGQVLVQLEATPLIYQKIDGEIRRSILCRFPYLIWYRVKGNSVIVLACTHGKRGNVFIRSHLR